MEIESLPYHSNTPVVQCYVYDLAFIRAFHSRSITNAGRCEFTGARVSQRGRCPVFCGSRQGRKDLGRRWQGIHRLSGKLGAVDPRLRSGSCCERSARGRNARLKFWNPESVGSGDGGIDLRVDAIDRESADGEQRYGSDHVVYSPRACVHRARQDHQVRRLLPRACRWAPSENGQWRAHSRAA